MTSTYFYGQTGASSLLSNQTTTLDIGIINDDHVLVRDGTNVTSSSDLWLPNTVNTTDATTTTIATISTISDTSYRIRAEIVAKQTGGISGSVNDSATFTLVASYNNNSGTLSQIGSDFIIRQRIAATNSWTVNTAISGTDILIRVVGQTNKNISWKSRVSYVDI